MKTLKEKLINEFFDKGNINLYTVVKVSVPGRKRKTSIAVYNFENFKENSVKLDYEDQIIFKYYCFYKWGVSYDKYEGLHASWVPVNSFKEDEKTKYNFYFDNIDCVDGSTDETIKGVKCDGSMTFKDAREALEKHFSI